MTPIEELQETAKRLCLNLTNSIEQETQQMNELEEVMKSYEYQFWCVQVELNRLKNILGQD